jgi:hypothetical protein
MNQQRQRRYKTAYERQKQLKRLAENFSDEVII